jgi:hypothetical protein
MASSLDHGGAVLQARRVMQWRTTVDPLRFEPRHWLKIHPGGQKALEPSGTKWKEHRPDALCWQAFAHHGR